MIRLFWCVGGGGSDRVEIKRCGVSLSHTAEYGFFVEQRLGFTSSFPEVTGTIVFFVGSAGDTFIQGFHEPADIKKTFTPVVDKQIRLIAFVWLNSLMIEVFVRNVIAGTTLMCPANNLDCRLPAILYWLEITEIKCSGKANCAMCVPKTIVQE